MSSAQRPSCACPAVNFSVIGTRVGDDLYLRGQTAPRAPHASGSNVSRTGAVSALCAPPSCVRPVPVNPDQGGTHRLLRSVISCRHRVEYTVPDTDPAPPDEPIVAEGAIAVGNVGPGRSCPEPPVDAVRNLPVVHPSDATRLVRQERFDDQPFEIDRFVTAVRQAALLFQTSEPAIPKGRYSFMRAKTSRVPRFRHYRSNRHRPAATCRAHRIRPESWSRSCCSKSVRSGR